MIPKSLYGILDVRRHTNILEGERIKEYVLVNLSSVISRDDVTGLLNLSKDRFQSKKRVNKIMRGKIDEVTKETEIILRQFLIDQRVDVNVEEPSQDTPVLKVHVSIPDKQKYQSPKKATLEGQSNDQTLTNNVDSINDTSGEVV